MWAYIAVAAVLGLGGVRPVGFGLSGAQPAVYQLDGYLDSAPAGQMVYFKVVLGFGAQDRTYLITKYTRQGDGDSFAMFRNLGMFRPDFVLIGPPEPLEAMVSARPATQVSGTFFYRRGMHILEVDPHGLKIE